MRLINLFLYGLAATVLSLPAQASGPYQAGQRLNAKQASELGNLAVYTVGSRQYRLLPDKAADGGSLLLDASGAVSSSRHEIIITGASENEVQSRTSQGLVPTTVQHFAATGITVVRYADFPAAVTGLRQLQQQLPQASIRLGIDQGRLQPH